MTHPDEPLAEMCTSPSRTPMRRPSGRPRDARGAVTAELALVLPLLVAVTIGLVWLLAVGADQLRAVDAARETARAVARGDAPGAAVGVGQQVAPDGALVRLSTRGGQVHVTVTGEVAGPGGIFEMLPPARLHVEAVAVIEQGSP